MQLFAAMKNTDNMLQTKVEALDHLLGNPRPDDCLWSDQLLTALEQVSAYALPPEFQLKPYHDPNTRARRSAFDIAAPP